MRYIPPRNVRPRQSLRVHRLTRRIHLLLPAQARSRVSVALLVATTRKSRIEKPWCAELERCNLTKDKAAPFDYVNRLTGIAQSHWRRSLLNSDDYHERAAGLLLQSSGWDYDPIT